MAGGSGFSVSGGGGGGGLAGAAPRDYNPASGGVPGVTSPIATITGNLGNLGGIISSITGSQNQALRSQYPNEYFTALGTLLGNVNRRAAGDISDLLPELQTGAAERAVAGGVSGSAAENTKLLRDIGLTRYGVENQAVTDLGNLQREIPQVGPFDPSGLINAQIQAQQMADLYAAAPNPEAAYQRALSLAGGGGGPARPPGGVVPARLAPGQGGGSVDDILRNYGNNIGGYGPPIIAHGTRTGELPIAQYGDEFGGEAGGPLDIGDEFGGEDLGSDYSDYENYGGGGYEDYGGGDYYDEEF